jgi:hypothetical protein
LLEAIAEEALKTMTSPKMVGKATAVTNAEGNFRLFSLPSGTYSVVFSLSGFKTLKRDGVVVQLGQTLTLNVTLPFSVNLTALPTRFTRIWRRCVPSRITV